MQKHYLIPFILIAAFSGCASLKKYANIEEPRVKIEKVKIKRMDLKTADLDITLKIINNNPISINLAGFDYLLKVEGKDFLKGNQAKGANIKASGPSEFNIPLELNISDLYGIYKSVADKETIKYDIRLAAVLDIPVLGKQRFPVKTQGTIPIIRIPKIQIAELKVASINFTGAKLKLITEIDNPNSFDIHLTEIKYSLKINGAKWISNSPGANIDLKSKRKNKISLPFEVNFIDLGKSAYNLLTSKSALDYQLEGNFNLNTGLQYFSSENIAFEKKDKIKLTQ